MEFFTTGIEAVDKLGHLSIRGDIKPRIWHKTIVNENGKPQRLAMDILAEIVYWYRPEEVRDERTGEVTGWKKKFAGDMLQKDYNYFVQNYGESEKTVQRSLVFLEELGVIKRHRKSIRLKSGTIAHNVMFIELIYSRLYELTYPQEEQIKKNEVLATVSEEFEIIAEEEYRENADEMGVSTEWTNLSNKSDENVQVLRQKCPSTQTKMFEVMDRNDHTNTYTTTKSTTKGVKSLSNQLEDTKMKLNAELDIDEIIVQVEELIAFDFLLKDIYDEKGNFDILANEFNSVLNNIKDVLVYEVFASSDSKRFNFGSKDDPDYKSNAIVKKVFYKHLDCGKVFAYIKQYFMHSKDVINVPIYHIKSLYRQCLTQSSQYMSGGRSFHARESDNN